MPVHNAAEYLRQTIASIQQQTWTDFEVLCVDDGSSDDSLSILEEVAGMDDRFVIIRQTFKGKGAARNHGFCHANGQYTICVDDDLVCDPAMLEKMYEAIISVDGDIAVCDFSKTWLNGRVTLCSGVHTDWIPEGMTVFSWRNTPDYIMRILDPTPCNRLYRTEFIREKGLTFDEWTSANEITFASVSAAAAERIVYVKEPLLCLGVGDSANLQDLKDVVAAIESTVRQCEGLPHSHEIRNAILSFVVDQYIASLYRDIKDFSSKEAAWFYQTAHELFNEDTFAVVDARTLHNPKKYREFCTVRSHDYETMKKMVSKRLIVSVTTYPKRIGTLAAVLKTIFNQTRKADLVVLWLAREQFPGGEADIPQDLRTLVQDGKLVLRWCYEDLKPHKKYFYAFQEFPHDLIVTVDDDLYYPRYTLDALYRSYLQHPQAVSAMRAHLILLNEQNELLPYQRWVMETDQCAYQPSMQLIATGVAGVLYSPELFSKDFLDKSSIMETCLWADDLWLKAMEVMADVPVVVAHPYERLQYLPGSQDEALCHENVGNHRNDVQMQQISRWLDQRYGDGSLIRRLTESETGTKILGMESVSQHIDQERKKLRRDLAQMEMKAANYEARAQQAELERDELKKKLGQTEERLQNSQEKCQNLERKLRDCQNQLHRTEQKLRQVQKQKSDLEPLASFGGQYRDLGSFLQQLKQKNGGGLSWYLKYALYKLAWIPEKLLVATNNLLRHGMKDTVKRLRNKITRKG